MVKMTIADVTYEGSPQELKEFFEQLGAKFPVEEEYRKVVGRKPKVGDYVKYTESDSINDISADKYYEITGIDEDGDYEFIDDAGDISVTISGEDDFEIYEKVCAYKPEAAPLKVGDYVKTLTDSKFGSLSAGTIGIIKEIDCEGDYVVKPITDEILDGLYDSTRLVKATDEEIAEAKAEFERQQVKSKWAKIGRKPGEFKKGDIVEVTGEITGKKFHGVVDEIDAEETFKFKEFREHYRSTEEFSRTRLIAPVESRVDL